MNTPLVSCVMPTANRRAFIPRAIRYFLEQDYPNKELVIIDDGTEEIADLIPADPQVRYLKIIGKRPLGAKRNSCVREARGDLIMHWDDDDWMAPHRITYQTDALLRENAEVCGLARILYYDHESQSLLLYSSPRDQRRWLAGGSLLFRKAFWSRSPFPAVQVGSDTAFIYQQSLERAVFLEDYRFYVASIHPGNTSPKHLNDSPWKIWTEANLTDVIGPDSEFDCRPVAPSIPTATIGIIMVIPDSRELARNATIGVLSQIRNSCARLYLVDQATTDQAPDGALDWLKVLDARGDAEIMRVEASLDTGSAILRMLEQMPCSGALLLDPYARSVPTEWLESGKLNLKREIHVMEDSRKDIPTVTSAILLESRALASLGKAIVKRGGPVSSLPEFFNCIVAEASKYGFRQSPLQPLTGCRTPPRGNRRQTEHASSAELTVVVGVRAGPEETERRRNLRACLIALNLQQLERWRYRIVVVEQDATPSLKDFVSAFADEYRFIKNTGPYLKNLSLETAADHIKGALCTIDAGLLASPDLLHRGLAQLKKEGGVFNGCAEIQHLDPDSTSRAIDDRFTAPMARRYVSDYRGPVSAANGELLFMAPDMYQRFLTRMLSTETPSQFKAQNPAELEGENRSTSWPDRILHLHETHRPAEVALRLVTNYYADRHSERDEELKAVVQKNIQDDRIDQIVLLAAEDDVIPFPNDKIVVVRLPVRPTFQDHIDAANRHTRPHDINIISNLDIFFDDSLDELQSLKPDQCFALSRYDLQPDGSALHRARPDSQDTWIFRGIVRLDACDIPLGKAGCDNRIAYLINAAGYNISNPSGSIRTLHHHLSAVRNYDRQQPIPGPYLLLPPKSLTKVLHVALNSVDGHQSGLHQALSTTGNLIEFDWQRHPGSRDDLNATLLELVHRHNPAWIFAQLQTDDVIAQETAIEMAKKTKCFSWNGDVRAETPQHQIDLGRAGWVIGMTNLRDVDRLKQLGIKAAYVQIGFSTDTFRPQGPVLKEAEIVFLGNNYRDAFPLSRQRSEMVRVLQERYGSRFRVYGNNWGAGTRRLTESEEAALYRGSKIAVGHNHFCLPRYSSDRNLRAMGSGCFFISSWYDQIEDDFRRDYHCQWWSSLSELIRLIDYYLENEIERTAIAQRGCEHVHANCTWANRVAQIRDLIDLRYESQNYRSDQYHPSPTT